MSISSAPSRKTSSISPRCAAVEDAGDGRGRPAPARSRDRAPPTRAAAVCSTLKPFQPSRMQPRPRRSLRASASTAAPSARASAPWPTMTIGFLRRLQRLGEGMAAVGQLLQRRRPGAQILDSGRSGPAAGRSSPTLQAAAQQALAHAGVDQRRFPARVAADQQDRIGLLDAGDGGVEQVAGRAARARAARRPGGNRGSASRARAIRSFSANMRLGIAEVAGDAPRSRAPCSAFGLRRDRGEGLVPGRRPAACRRAADIGPVEPLADQAVAGDSASCRRSTPRSRRR